MTSILVILQTFVQLACPCISKNQTILAFSDFADLWFTDQISYVKNLLDFVPPYGTLYLEKCHGHTPSIFWDLRGVVFHHLQMPVSCQKEQMPLPVTYLSIVFRKLTKVIQTMIRKLLWTLDRGITNWNHRDQLIEKTIWQYNKIS